MATISKSTAVTAADWTRVDEGYSSLTMQRRLVYPVYYFIGAAEPVDDEDDGVHTWTAGAITVRDLGGSKVFVKGVEEDNTIELMLGEAAIPLQSSTADSATVTLSLDTSAYATGDVLAATQEIADVVPSVGDATALHSLVILDKDDQGQGLDIVFLDANVPLGTENAAPSITDANAAHVLGIVSVAAADFVDLGGCRVATLSGIGLVLQPAADSRSVYVAAISRGTGTYTAAGIDLRLGFI